MKRIILMVAVVAAMALPTLAQSIGSCEPGKAANDYESWEYIANNALRTADAYATKRNPNATFIFAEIDAIYQLAGKHVGNYLVTLLQHAPNGTSFAQLKPTFDFCADPSGLDDSREDLFKVVNAKFNGRPF